MPGDHRGFDAEIFVPEGGLARLARGIPPGGTGGLWDGPSGFHRPKLVSGRFLQPRAAKLSLPLFSPLSLSFPHLFPCPFLTPSLTPSLCKPQNSGGFRVRLQSFGFTPAALAQLVPVPAVTPGQEPSPVATGTERVSPQAWGGRDFSSR